MNPFRVRDALLYVNDETVPCAGCEDGTATDRGLPMNGSWGDSQLVWLAQQGDQAVIRALVCDAHPHVTRLAYTLCASPQDAEDAAQEAIIILFRKIGTLRACPWPTSSTGSCG